MINLAILRLRDKFSIAPNIHNSEGDNARMDNRDNNTLFRALRRSPLFDTTSR